MYADLQSGAANLNPAWGVCDGAATAFWNEEFEGDADTV